MHRFFCNVNDAYPAALVLMRGIGIETDSRAGNIMRLPSPYMTSYEHPEERMLFDEKRDANPFFHLFEAMWMLAGRDDVNFVSQFNPRMIEFSDNGSTLHGAYGHRWRGDYIEQDQIRWVIQLLQEQPTTRRAVISMWNPADDMIPARSGGKDVPCNTTIYFNQIIPGELDMTVCCRSNDMIWGCYGANVVHMSVLHEFVANATNIKMGRYHQLSNDLHIYERHYDLLKDIEQRAINPYKEFGGQLVPVLGTQPWEDAIVEIEAWVERPGAGVDFFQNQFLRKVIGPMYDVWTIYKLGTKRDALTACMVIGDPAVRQACEGWINRRIQK